MANRGIVLKETVKTKAVEGSRRLCSENKKLFWNGLVDPFILESRRILEKEGERHMKVGKHYIAAFGAYVRIFGSRGCIT